jgi:hypothetical protein
MSALVEVTIVVTMVEVTAVVTMIEMTIVDRLIPRRAVGQVRTAAVVETRIAGGSA